MVDIILKTNIIVKKCTSRKSKSFAVALVSWDLDFYTKLLVECETCNAESLSNTVFVPCDVSTSASNTDHLPTHREIGPGCHRAYFHTCWCTQ